MTPSRTAITVLGASGRTGSALCRALLARGDSVIPVVRDRARWAARGLPVEPRLAELGDPAALKAALEGAGRIVSTAHARWTPAIQQAAAADATLVLIGSTRRFSRWPDAHGDGVRAGEAAFLAGPQPGVMLHPTMIYGAQGENNVQRLAALLRRLPVAPLPGGGHALVQPIYQDDLTACLLAALNRPWAAPRTLVVAGPEPVAYRDFLAKVARAAGRRAPPVLPMPLAPLFLLGRLAALVPGLPRIGPDELRRLTEDKAFDIAEMREVLGVSPRPLREGLAATFRP
ncbi:NADH-ubiquinone oxidoreductase [Pseudoroseomonas rhizosphaerae]|uniref:NADH-ubiquinone oxidoreductase n=1 Tax=Teichococcus rhizosphaerae TaxID=1335062 RepID=A0A2C7AAF0_9PROT|nr:NAD(P)H-binding protein [Pseudoroseomonas rhizosphaerae]PHK95370.1 NADH-ubiquinone oxidoreductase [Pseudoroseomonas rhizosphaerae]